MLFFFGICDKHGVELPFIQMLMLHDACLVYTAEDSGRFLMTYHSLRSQPCSNPVVVAGVCITYKIYIYFLCNSRGETYQKDEDWTDVFAENE